MSVIDQLREAASAVVEVGGLRWKIQRVNSETMAKHSQGWLLMLKHPQKLMEAGLKAAADGAEGDELKGVLSSLIPKHLNFGELRRKTEIEDGVVCAGVVAVAGPDGEFEPISLSQSRKHAADMNARGGGDWLCVADLTPATRRTLYAEILALTTGGQEGSARLAAFRQQPGDAGDL